MIVCFYLENVCYSFKLVVILLELIHLCINNIFTLPPAKSSFSKQDIRLMYKND